jgi:hypothetical protein
VKKWWVRLTLGAQLRVFPAPAEGLEVAAVSDAIISRGRIMIVKTGNAIPLDYRTAGRDLAAPLI